MSGDAGPVDSVKHPLIGLARTLGSRAGRTAEGRCLADGARLVTQIIEAGAPVEAVLVPAGTHQPALRAAADAAGVEVHDVKTGVLRHAIGTSTGPDALAICALPPERSAVAPEGTLTVVCDRVLDPGNLGSIIRVGVGLGAPGIVLIGDEDPGARRVVDASRGAVLRAELHRFADAVSAVEALRAAGWWVIAADASAPTPIDELELAGSRLALVVGNETDGVSAAAIAAADERGAIGLAAGVESLNVAVAAGIGLWAFGHRRG